MPKGNKGIRCPGCGFVIGYSEWKIGEGIKVRFYCSNCKIEWHIEKIVSVPPPNPPELVGSGLKDNP